MAELKIRRLEIEQSSSRGSFSVFAPLVFIHAIEGFLHRTLSFFHVLRL